MTENNDNIKIIQGDERAGKTEENGDTSEMSPEPIVDLSPGADAAIQDFQKNEQQEPQDSPSFGVTEFIVELDELSFSIEKSFLKSHGYDFTDLLTLGYENEDGVILSYDSLSHASSYGQHFSSITEYLPYWLFLINGTNTLSAVITNTVEYVFEMSPDAPLYAVLSSITASGTIGNDTISGSLTEENVIDGLAGDDVITGGNLTDQLWGGDGNDTISGGAGDDRIFGAAGDDILTGGTGEDWIWGGDGADQISGNAGDDFISGNDGDDVIYGHEGSDTIYGGVDNDTIYALDADSDNKDDLTYENLIYGEEGDDTLYGSSGEDTLDGGSGNDTLNSGSAAGDDFEDLIMGFDPIVYYRLGEITGSTAYDKAGNQNATYSDGIQYEQDGFDNALIDGAVKLDGRDEQVIRALDDARFDTTEGSVSAWFNVDNLTTNHAVFSKDEVGDVNGQFYLGVDTNGDIYGRVQQDGVDDSFTFDPTAALGGKVQTGQWYMLTLSYGAGGADIYINDEFLGSSATLTRTDSDRSLIIGARNSHATPNQEFDGHIDEVAWFQNEMDATDVGNLYNAGITATDNAGLPAGVYVDVNGTGTFNAGNQIASLEDVSYASDELTMLNNNNLII